MRNLQKILALVLALVMSFSLVTTAGAFSDDGDISQDYSDAVEVLNALKVYQGYGDGRFDPKGSITRAEVAAIIYRIATGDVTDSQASIYSSYGQFTDVADGSWYAGYVNYCANAGYVKGKGNKTFDPQGKVTGYEALAMILRAVGYDKNGEFTGSLWQVNTASIAQERGITKNVTTALLGEPASREMVAEILFRSILVSKVNFNANTLSYTEANSSIGYESFKLEEVTGVVTANEFADLYDTDVLAEGKTSLEVAPGDVRTLNYSTDLTDIGEKQNAYITDTQVLAMAKHDDVKVFESNAKLDVSTDKKFEDETGFKKTSGTEFYVNFGRDGKYDSDYRIEFNITFEKGNKGDTPAEVMKWFEKEYLDGTTIDKIMTLDKSHSDSTKQVYTKILRAETEITQDDLDVIKGIFSAADDEKDNGSKNDYDGISGDVYVGTKSNPDRTDRDDDISNEISYKQFFKEYINSETWDKNWETSNNGEWVKVIDNNNDGKAEYAFKTQYWLDEATHSRSKNGETEIEYNYLDSDDYDYRYLDGFDPAVGDVVLYTLIDGQALIQEVKPVKATINHIDFKNETITTTDGDEYGQSGIFNKTDMDDVITVMDEKVEYNLYQDKYGYVRAYELTEGTKYGLLTELYYGYYQNGRFVTSKDLTVEMRAGSAKVDEYAVTNSRDNDFTGNSNWYDLKAPYRTVYQTIGVGNTISQRELAEKNILQTATAHLGLVQENLNKRFSGPDSSKYLDENKTEYTALDAALTNVAKYVMSDDGVKINSVAEYAYEKETGKQLFYNKDSDGKWVKNTDKNGTYATPVYAVDYIQLDASKEIKEDQRVYTIDTSATNQNNVVDTALLNAYVNAVHDTEFYLVSNNVAGSNRVTYFTDYEKVPAIKADKVSAVYAVARNTESDNANRDYWVADVIVIEVDNWTDDYDSISLAYYTNNYRGGTVRSLDTLNNKLPKDPTTIVPDPDEYTWNFRDWDDSKFGFYRLYDTTVDGSTITVDSLSQITDHFSDYDIYAGEITRIDVVDGARDNYIMVDIGTGKVNEKDVNVTDVYNDATYSLLESGNQNNYKTVAEHLHMCDARHSDVKKGDHIIWIGNKDAKFMVVVDYEDDGNIAPSWLYGTTTDADGNITGYTGLYGKILKEQMDNANVSPVTKYYDVTVQYRDNADNSELRNDETFSVEENTSWSTTPSKVDSYKFLRVENATSNDDGTISIDKVTEKTIVTVYMEKDTDPEYVISEVKFVDDSEDSAPVAEATYTLNDKKNVVTLNLPEDYEFVSASYENNGATVTVNKSELGANNTIDLSNAALSQNVTLTVVLHKNEENPPAATVNVYAAIWVQNNGDDTFAQNDSVGDASLVVNEKTAVTPNAEAGTSTLSVLKSRLALNGDVWFIQADAVVDGKAYTGVESGSGVQTRIDFEIPNTAENVAIVVQFMMNSDIPSTQFQLITDPVQYVQNLRGAQRMASAARENEGEEQPTAVTKEKTYAAYYATGKGPEVNESSIRPVGAAVRIVSQGIIRPNYPENGMDMWRVTVEFTGNIADASESELGVILAPAELPPENSISLTTEDENITLPEGSDKIVAAEDGSYSFTVTVTLTEGQSLASDPDVVVWTDNGDGTWTGTIEAGKVENGTTIAVSIKEGETTKKITVHVSGDKVKVINDKKETTVYTTEAEVGSTLTITAKLADDATDYAPYIASGASAPFEEVKGQWTAAVTVTENLSYIDVAAGEGFPVELEVNPSLKNVLPTPSDASPAVSTSYAVKSNVTDLYSKAVFLVTLPNKDSVPEIIGLEDNANATHNKVVFGTNGDVVYTCVDETTNRWSITLNNLKKYDTATKYTGNLTIGTSKTVTLRPVNSNVSLGEEGGKLIVKDGKASGEVYITTGMQPDYDAAGYGTVVKITKSSKAPADGKTCWDVEVTGVTRSMTINIGVKTDGRVTLTTGTDRDKLEFDNNAKTKIVPVSGGTVKFTAFVNKDNDAMPVVKASSAEVSYTAEQTSDKNSKGWTAWDVTVTDLADSVTELTLTTATYSKIILSGAANSGITPTGVQIAYVLKAAGASGTGGAATDVDKANRSPVFTVTLPADTEPKVKKVDGALGEIDYVTGGTPDYELKLVDVDANTWEIKCNCTGGASADDVILTVSAQAIPSVTVDVGGGITLVGDGNSYVPKLNKDGNYDVTIDFTMAGGNLLTPTVDIKDGIDGTTPITGQDYTISGPEQNGDSGEFSLTISFKSGAFNKYKDIHVELSTEATYTVTVKADDDGISKIDPAVQSVKAGENADIKVTLADGFKLVKPTKEEKKVWDITSEKGNTATIRVSNVQENVEITLKTTKGSAGSGGGLWNVGTAAYNNNITAGTGLFEEGKKEWEVAPANVGNGMIPTVTLTLMGSTAEVDAESSVVYDKDKEKWVITVTNNGDDNVDVKFDSEFIVLGTWDAQTGSVVDEGGEAKLAGVTILPDSSAAADKFATFKIAVDSSITETKADLTFVVLVHEKFNLENVTTSENTLKVKQVDVEEADDSININFNQEEWRAVMVTLVADSGGIVGDGSATIKINVAPVDED